VENRNGAFFRLVNADQPAALEAATGGTRHGKGISKSVGAHELEPASLSELIHQQVRVAMQTARAREAAGRARDESVTSAAEVRQATDNGIRERTLTGPTGPVRSRCLGPPSSEVRGDRWDVDIVPRYQRQCRKSMSR